jgi:hypothetical protein
MALLEAKLSQTHIFNILERQGQAKKCHIVVIDGVPAF